MTPSFAFGDPAALVFLCAVPIWVFFSYWGYRKRQARLLRLQDKAVKGGLSLHGGKISLKTTLSAIAMVLCIVALARPRWGFEWVEMKRRGIDLVIAVDVSRSMLSQDISPSRLERSKRKIKDFLELIGGDRVGLVAFAGVAYVQCPVTEDHGALRMFIDYLDPDLVPFQGTDLYQAISVGLKALQEGGQGDGKDRAMILLSDGEATESDESQVQSAIELAKKAGVQIYTVGVGTEAGGPIPDVSGSFKRDENGNIIVSRPDEVQLKKIAHETGGFFVRSVADDIDLRQIYFEGIKKRLEERDIRAGHEKNWFERYQWLIGCVLILLFVEGMIRDIRVGALAFLLAFIFSSEKAEAFSLSTLFGTSHKSFEKGDYKAATEGFLREEAKNPEDAQTIYNRSVSQYKQGQYKDAAQGFAKSSALTQDPELAKKSLFNAANAYVGLGDLDKAISGYEGLLEMDPQDIKAKENLEYVKNLKKQKQDQSQNQDQKQDNQQEKKQDQSQNQKQEQQSQKEQNQNSDESQKLPSNKEEPNQQEEKPPMSARPIDDILDSVKDQAPKYQWDPTEAPSRRTPKKDW